VPAPEGATEEQRASDERVHRAFVRYQLAYGEAKFGVMRCNLQPEAK
jgi:hypothetical protein